MARPLEDLTPDTPGGAVSARRRLRRSTARAFAAALATLAISALVITTSSSALEPGGTASDNAFSTGSIELTDDDAGRSLVDLEDMAPNRPVERCVRVEYGGTIVPVDLTIGADADGDLVPYVLVEVERGTGASFGDCSTFESASEVFSGTLAEFEEAGAIDIDTLRNRGDAVSFRFRFEIADDARAVGRSGTAVFEWEVRPS